VRSFGVLEFFFFLSVIIFNYCQRCARPCENVSPAMCVCVFFFFVSLPFVSADFIKKMVIIAGKKDGFMFAAAVFRKRQIIFTIYATFMKNKEIKTLQLIPMLYHIYNKHSLLISGMLIREFQSLYIFFFFKKKKKRILAVVTFRRWSTWGKGGGFTGLEEIGPFFVFQSI
jgi:hypothetical protein